MNIEKCGGKSGLAMDSGWGDVGSMKTTIDIPYETLQEAFRFTGAKTKKEAVLLALDDFNRRKRMAAAARLLGQSETFMTPADLRRMRQARRAK